MMVLVLLGVEYPYFFLLQVIRLFIFPASQIFRHSRSSLTRSLMMKIFFEENDRLVSSTYMLTWECFVDKGRSVA